MKLKLYILSLLFTLISGLCQGQFAPPWSYVQTPTSMELLFTNVTSYTIGDRNVNQSDYVGVFYQLNGIEICAGYGQLTSEFIHVTTYSDSLFNPGMYLKLWNGNIGCEVDSVTVTDTDWNMQFNADSAEIRGLHGNVYREVSYPQMTFCMNIDSLIIPNYSPHNFTASFTATGGLVADSLGRFIPSENQPGIYQIDVRHDYCLAMHTLQVSIVDADTCYPPVINKENILAPGSGNPDYQTIEFTTPGTIRVFNVQGVEVRTLYGPAEWDGTDNNGRLLPTDEYYILFESGEQKLITILR